MSATVNHKSSVIHFLQQKVIGKTLRTDPVTYQMEGGKLEGEFSGRATFSDMTEGRNSFCFDLIMVNKETVYALKKSGKELIQERSHENVNVFRYELAQRVSTGRMTGLLQIKASTVADQEAIAWGLHQVQVEENKLSWQEVQLLYRDMVYTTGKYRPVAQHAAASLFIEKEMLHFRYDVQLFEITDIATLKRELSKDTLPSFLFKEVKSE